MSKGRANEITPLARPFLVPANTTHRQYEALRAYFVDGLPSAEAARRFGYTPGSFRVLCHSFRQNPDRPFFLSPRRRPPGGPAHEKRRERIVALRKQNLSIYDISRILQEEGTALSPAAVSNILRDEGFTRLPRRRDEERPPSAGPAVAEKADARKVDLEPRSFRTKFGGLFLFLPYLARIPLDHILARCHFPGTKMVPAGCALRSLLALKLFGSARHSHVMSYVFDEGLALFAGLNRIPKRSFLTEYSCRVDPGAIPRLMARWFDEVKRVGLRHGASFDLDFHTIPFHGEDALVEKHYVSKRSRRQKGMLAFVAQDADKRVFCYANADLRKADQNDEVLRFVEFWKERTGRWPQEIVFDSKLTTYANLDELNARGIKFITLRRRSSKMLREIEETPDSAWRQVHLTGVGRIYRTPRILDRRVHIRDYEGALRQLTICDLGHEEPTLLLTNQLRRGVTKLIDRYAQRMVIENGIADSIDFFHMDALSSAVALKMNLDLQLTLMASSLYRLLGAEVGHGYERAKSRHIFRDLVDATAHVAIDKDGVHVRFQKRAHNPQLLAAGFARKRVRIPWLGNRRLRLVFG